MFASCEGGPRDVGRLPIRSGTARVVAQLTTKKGRPSIAYFSESRKGVLTEHGAEGAPDLVVEILSPSTEKYDLYQKRVVYARTGVTELWIVDPKNFEVRVFRLHKDPDSPTRLLRFSDVLTSDLLPGLALPVERLFRRF